MIKQKSSEMGVSKKEKRGLVITEIFMILLAAVWFIPIYYLIVTTFKNPQEATQSPLGLPKVWVFQNYVDAFVNMQYPILFTILNRLTIFIWNGTTRPARNSRKMRFPHLDFVLASA